VTSLQTIEIRSLQSPPYTHLLALTRNHLNLVGLTIPLYFVTDQNIALHFDIGSKAIAPLVSPNGSHPFFGYSVIYEKKISI
jgi:hypothetical protein